MNKPCSEGEQGNVILTLYPPLVKPEFRFARTHFIRMKKQRGVS